MQKYDAKVKFLMLGQSGVGKSSLLVRFTDNIFSSNFVTTLGVEYQQKMVKAEDQNLLVQVWDTAGQQRFKTITPIYYRSVDGVVVVYDITDQDSFDNINYWMKNLKENADVDQLVTILVGNKTDLIGQRVVQRENAQALALQYGLQYFETSAQSNTNVQEIFMHIAVEIINKKGDLLNKPVDGNGNEGTNKITNKPPEQKQSDSCCQ